MQVEYLVKVEFPFHIFQRLAASLDNEKVSSPECVGCIILLSLFHTNLSNLTFI